MKWFKRKNKENKKEGIIRIRLSGDENIDIENSFKAMGINSKEKQEEILKNYSWHYLDDLDENLECTMQLVQTEALEASKPFSDSRDIMEEVIGIKYIRKEGVNVGSILIERDFSEIRSQSIAICEKSGFRPANSLPTIKEVKLRPTNEIAGRLNAIKALVLWLMVPSDNLPDVKINQFVSQNELLKYMTSEEKEILNSSREDVELRNSIGWKFENAWPLAWYFGYKEPDILGQMMSSEQMQEILTNYSCPLDDNIDKWIKEQKTITEESTMEKEDLFYCVHNAVRSAQLGRDTVPKGFDPVENGGVIHERRHSLTWMLSNGVDWEETDLST